MVKQALLDEHLPGRTAALPGELDRAVHGVLIGEAQVHDNFPDHARGTSRVPGRVQAAALADPRGGGAHGGTGGWGDRYITHQSCYRQLRPCA